jgi:thiaminase/transcriptional activator TenA
MPERFTETLRVTSEAGWSHAVQHRFVNELFAGAVPDAVMARYLIQDHHFVLVPIAGQWSVAEP